MENASEIPINQKEYLKKYLSMGRAPGEKRKKKKKVKPGTRVQIIDDDVVNTFSSETIEQGPIIIDEDAPQIVAIIDERPHALRVDEKTNNPLWRPVGEARQVINEDIKPVIKGFKIAQRGSESVLVRTKSPPRKKKRQVDISPPRVSPEGRTPPRRPEDDVVIKQERLSVSPPRKRNDQDMSPPRKRNDRDMSPPRKRCDDDMSPPRKSRKFDDDKSPPRKNRHGDISPPRRNRSRHDTPPPRRKKDSNKSPPRRKDRSHSRWEPKTKDKKMEKTLDGKRAGLQDARELIQETRNFKNREDQLFKSLEKEVSGENAETVHRDRRTGKIRDFEEEEEQKRKKREEEDKNKEKYERWGRGLAQVENKEEQLKEQLHEMNKPLARYADDEDLERYLKEQEREGDPMLMYLRKKRKKNAADRGEVTKPKFEGEFMPNRYAIRPGHRWDGVDRSNGYEKRWFEVQNEKKAMLEDAYKWSTEDM